MGKRRERKRERQTDRQRQTERESGRERRRRRGGGEKECDKVDSYGQTYTYTAVQEETDLPLLF